LFCDDDIKWMIVVNGRIDDDDDDDDDDDLTVVGRCSVWAQCEFSVI